LVKPAFTQGLKPSDFAGFLYGLMPVPFTAELEVDVLPKVFAITAAMCLLAAAVAVPIALRPATRALAASMAAPTYAKNGDMLPPGNYREWIFLTSGIDMSYAPKAAAMADHSMFDNVFVNPEAYRSFLASGTWPDKTVMILENREARSKGSINERGHFQSGDVIGFEIHVKDVARFPGKWAFFSFDSPSGNGTLIPQGAPCYTCHAAHGAVDTTFAQFYPTLLPVAAKKGTLSAKFLKEDAAQNAPGK
jgi:hypothetical protein